MKNLRLKIHDYGYFGEGVGKADGKVAFVPYSIEGEIIDAMVCKETSTFYRCKINSIIKKSNLRQNAPCPYFAKCGGCAFQHLSYQEEIKIKRGVIKSQLQKIGYTDEVKINPCEYFYRNKIRLFCNDKGLALYENGSNNYVNIEICLIVEEAINDAISKIQTFIMAKKLGKHIKTIEIRHLGENTLVHFYLNKNIEIDYVGLQIMLGAKCGIYESVKNSGAKHISGIKELEVKEFGLSCAYQIESFHQVNNNMANMLYKKVLENILNGDVINAYSGGGLLSGIIAKQNKKVFGIEIGQKEHLSAEKLKEANKLNKLFNICGDCAEKLPIFIGSNVKTIIVDPPRSGCDKKVCEAINNSNIERLIYVSCEASTLVRDIKLLKNYKIKETEAFDMFPRTSSVELLCIMEHK